MTPIVLLGSILAMGTDRTECLVYQFASGFGEAVILEFLVKMHLNVRMKRSSVLVLGCPEEVSGD